MAVTFTALNLNPILTHATCLYEPSMYNGTGLETRKNLMLVVDETVRAQIAEIEAQIGLVPTLCSILKPEAIRVKIDTSNRCRPSTDQPS